MLSLAACGGSRQAGDRAQGEKLFTELQCAACHSVRGVGGNSAPALGGQGYTPNTMAGALWSHVSAMWPAMDKAGIKRSPMDERQAADIFTYVAGTPGSDRPGDSARGRQVFEAKLCASCHDEGQYGSVDLTAKAGSVTPFSMVSSVWLHGDGMLSRMVSKNTQWQAVTADEMGDIVAYLNSKKK